MDLADAVTRMADAQAVAYARKIEKVYTQAAKEVKRKMDDFWKAHRERAEKLRKQVQAGTISERDYQAWLRGQVFQGKQWEQKLKDVTEVYVNADAKAREILGGTTKNVFMQAANHTAYDIEKQLGGAVAFNVYDKETVERLTKDNPKMLPEWKIDEPKDYVWNEKRVQNAVTQGIIQGESVRDIGSRLTSELATSNAKKMDMFARTAVTGAQNAGRVERLHETEELGIEVKKKWLATLDDRTRDAHADLDGQEVGVDEPFTTKDGRHINYPGDPTADADLVYNCRCTLIYVYPKYQHLNNAKRRDQETGEVIDDMTYREWEAQKQEHKNVAVEKAEEHTIAQGTNITDTWKRRPDQFAFEIEDVMDAQGFNGKPIVVDAEEFNKIAKENEFLAQRGYVAPDRETLEAYRQQLYGGKWYVDCSHGNAMYGQGMYAGANFTGEMTAGVKRVSEGYAGNGLGYVETFTMVNPRFVQYDDISSAFNGGFSVSDVDKLYSGLTKDEALFLDINASALFSSRQMPDFKAGAEAAQRLGEEGRTKVLKKFADALESAKERNAHNREKYKDVGAYAAACGYDGIICGRKDEDGVYVVILNRTKCVFRRP